MYGFGVRLLAAPEAPQAAVSVLPTAEVVGSARTVAPLLSGWIYAVGLEAGWGERRSGAYSRSASGAECRTDAADETDHSIKTFPCPQTDGKQNYDKIKSLSKRTKPTISHTAVAAQTD